MPLHDFQPDVRRRLAREADETTAQRAAAGPVSHVVAMLIFDFAFLRGRFTPLTVCASVLVLATAGLRQWFMKPERSVRRLGIEGWRRAFATTVLLMSASYGLYAMAAIRQLGSGAASALILAVTTAFVSGVIHAMAPRLWVARGGACLLLALPLAGIVMSTGTWRYAAVPLYAMYGGYALHLASRLHEEYWAGATTQAQLQTRGDELLRSQKQTRDLIENHPDSVVVLRGRAILYVNSSCATLLQRDPTDFVGEALEGFVQPEERVALLELIESAGEATHRPKEFRFSRRDGTHVIWEVLPGQKVDYDGAPALMLVARDVTDRHRLRTQLAISERLASIGTLAAGVAHEINNPLTYVLLNLEHVIHELSSAPPSNAEAATELAEIARESYTGAKRVQAIVRDLKTFSRDGEQGATAVDIHGALDLALKLSATELRHRARVVVERGNLPLVMADDIKLGQVFLNLLVNAAQAIPEGRADDHTVRIETSTDSAGNVLVAVSDTGVGIAPAQLSRIFDPFFTTKPVGVGTGLGLSICHNIVASFGGLITVTSEVGRGTTVTVQLRPGGGADRATSKAPATMLSEVPEDVVPGPDTRVLVVDDEPVVGSAIVRSLGAGFDVVLEQSSRRALARLEAGEHFDVVLCDVMMPELSGMALYHRIEQRAPDLAATFVFMTGGVFTTQASAFLESVPNPRIDKPFSPGKLRACIRSQASVPRQRSVAPSRRGEELARREAEPPVDGNRLQPGRSLGRVPGGV